jgi:hypothetical protein
MPIDRSGLGEGWEKTILKTSWRKFSGTGWTNLNLEFEKGGEASPEVGLAFYSGMLGQT